VTFEAWLADRRRQVDDALERLLPAAQGPAATVARAMRYAVLGGGKRLRPCTVLAACEACGGSPDDAVGPAAAIEMLHAYSLIHDDLPAMDDDDLRRGRPTVHRAFDEATAILAGDALQAEAFGILAALPGGEDRAGRRARAVVVAARGVGTGGMVGGQQADLEATGRSMDLEALEWVHRHKTGALLAACAEIGAVHAGADDQRCRALAAWGGALGLAFQIVDDVLDRTATAAALGKTPGKDARAAKSTYPALLGVDASIERARRLVDEALDGLGAAGVRDTRLAGITRYVVERSS
jgi:geranylgeranyl pyrophosphate synthase